LTNTGRPVEFKENIVNKHLPRLLLLAAAICAAGAVAQQLPPPPMVPRAEELATVPDLSAAQQAEVRKILIQRRDAQEAAHDKTRTEMEALRTRERNEHERIDGQTSDQLRKLLGDDGYRNYAEWSLAHRGGPHAMPPHHGPGDGPGMEHAPPPRQGNGPGPGPGPGHAAPSDETDD
jgi:hypothetical protein